MGGYIHKNKEYEFNVFRKENELLLSPNRRFLPNKSSILKCSIRNMEYVFYSYLKEYKDQVQMDATIFVPESLYIIVHRCKTGWSGDSWSWMTSMLTSNIIWWIGLGVSRSNFIEQIWNSWNDQFVRPVSSKKTFDFSKWFPNNNAICINNA